MGERVEGLMDGGLTVTGPLIVEHQVDVTAQRDGIVSRISAEAGTHVAAGTILAQLDDRQLTSNLEATRAKTRSTFFSSGFRSCGR